MTESKIVDKRVRSEANEYAISFAARDEKGSYEHAFVVWYFSDPLKRRTNRRAGGFYPAGGEKYKLLIGGVPGEVLDDSKEKIAKSLTILVNKEIFEQAELVEDQYNDNTYLLLANDCTTFVQKVCEVIPNLIIPNRTLNIYPSSFIGALYDKN